jgi:hypothetical protein
MNYEHTEDMFTDFQEFAESVKQNPRIKVEYVGKDGERVTK